jgi:hypothetical protein
MLVLQKGRRVLGDERTQIASALKTNYESGASIRDLASSIGRSYGFVHHLLVEAGTALRPRGFH